MEGAATSCFDGDLTGLEETSDVAFDAVVFFGAFFTDSALPALLGVAAAAAAFVREAETSCAFDATVAFRAADATAWPFTETTALPAGLTFAFSTFAALRAGLAPFAAPFPLLSRFSVLAGGAFAGAVFD
ncbi:MAG: hypothetical protein ACK4MV_21275 [Beijerinckiaceae bacterium]